MARIRDHAASSRGLPPLLDLLEGEERALVVYLNGGNPSMSSWVDLRAELVGVDLLRPTSKSAVQRMSVRAVDKLAQAFSMRSLSHLNLAAIMIDGTPIGGETALWALGVTMDGTKVPLGSVQGATETVELVSSLLTNLEERGLDMSDVLWVVDGGAALLKAIRDFTGGRARIQRCRVHSARNVVVDHLGEAAREPIGDGHRRTLGAVVREWLWDAWNQHDYERAAADLNGAADRLEQLGHHGAANSVRNGADQTLALQRLGIDDPALCTSLGTTNPIEGPHVKVSKSKQRANRFTERERGMRTRFLVGALAVAERGWTRIAVPASLERLPFAVVTGRHFEGVSWAGLSDAGTVRVTCLPEAAGAGDRDVCRALWDLLRWADRQSKRVEISDHVLAAASTLRPWLSKCGFVAAGGTHARVAHPPGAMDWAKVPSVAFSLRKLTAPSNDVDAARALMAGWFGPNAGGVCQGSHEALAALGLEPRQLAGLDELTAAAQGRRVDGGAWVRSRSSVGLVDADGVPTGERAPGVASLAWELSAPASVVQRWREADPERRAEIERSLVAAAEAALVGCVQAGGMAAAFVVQTEGDRAASERLRARGVVFGVERRAGWLASPIEKEVFRNEKERAAAEATAAADAAVALECELARLGPSQGLAPRRQAPVEPAWPPIGLGQLGERRAGWIAEQAELSADMLADRSRDWLESERARLGDPFEVLGVEHPDAWMRSYRWDAVKALALDRELTRRERTMAHDGRVGRVLDEQRELLGRRRVEDLAELAQRRVRELSHRDLAWLVRRRADVARLLTPIDPQAAHLTLWVERARAAAASAGRSTAKLEAGERRLHQSDWDLDTWLERHYADIAERAAIDALLHERDQAQAPATPTIAHSQERVQAAAEPAGAGMEL